MISFAARSLLVYRKMTKFCMLIFVSYFAQSIISSKCFLEQSLESLNYKTMSSAHTDNLVSLLLCLLYLAKALILHYIRLKKMAIYILFLLLEEIILISSHLL